LKATSPNIHPKFQLNGLSFQNAEELLNFAEGLLEQGDDFEISMAQFLEAWLNFESHVMVQTSGSTGTPKSIALSKSAMENSAIATGSYFKLGEGTKALLCLSSEFIAGKMMLVRAMVLGWDIHVVAPEKDALVQYNNAYDFVALVPYQVFHSLDALKKVKKIIIGGGVLPQNLEETLQDIDVEAFVTYGMTETITHVAARRVNGFARSDVYHALPEVQFETDTRGCLVITAPKIGIEKLVTNDQVELLSPISFKWLGRFDFVINSGGIKLHPETIERKLKQYLDLPFIISSEKDEALGEKVILVVEESENDIDFQEVLSKLDTIERPRKVYTLSKFPYTENGKIKRNQIKEVIQKFRK